MLDEYAVRAALYRSATMLGAIGRAVDLSAAYVSERRQFGRPLAAIQSVSQTLGTMAMERELADAALARAIRAVDDGDGRLAVAAARVTLARVARAVADGAHQVHGAMGVTEEYALQRSTRRLWAWRDELGSPADWARQLGGAARTLGPDEAWERLTA